MDEKELLGSSLVAVCECCCAEIHYADPYTTLTRRVEKRMPSPDKDEDEVHVFDYRNFWLCSVCGPHLTESNVEDFIMEASQLGPEYTYADDPLGQ